MEILMREPAGRDPVGDECRARFFGHLLEDGFPPGGDESQLSLARLVLRNGRAPTGVGPGSLQSRQLSVCGSRFDDLDGNGIRDVGEPGVEGWKIYLDADGDSIAAQTTLTDRNGDYAFTNLPWSTINSLVWVELLHHHQTNHRPQRGTDTHVRHSAGHLDRG